MRVIRFILIAVILIWGISFTFQTIFSVPSLDGRSSTTSIPASMDTQLGSIVLPLKEANQGKSGVAQLASGPNAFAARTLLANAAQSSIDARYYIWQKDLTGLLLLESLYLAAERGVRVRLLLDDNGTPELDPELAQLAAHPNIEVRLFNPFILRAPRVASLLLDFSRLNRRMHNKSFTVDGAVTIVGGRNIGDIYFARNESVNYFDFDIVALGDAAQEVSDDFDLYWSSDSAFPALDILPSIDSTQNPLESSVALVRAMPGGSEFDDAIKKLDLIDRLADKARDFEWAEMEMVSDDPAKGLGKVSTEMLMITRLTSILTPPKVSADLVSAYFIPGQKLTDTLTGWASAGIKVRTLTNAQEATDVLPVHSGYKKYRKKLVQAGIEVRELKRTLEQGNLMDQFSLTGESRSSLHAKTFVIDRSEIFVGSFNFDPRSAKLNTEMGFLIKSPSLAEFLSNTLDEKLENWAYKVEKDDNSELHWREEVDGGPDIVFGKEPSTTVFSRALVTMIGWLPVQWLL